MRKDSMGKPTLIYHEDFILFLQSCSLCKMHVDAMVDAYTAKWQAKRDEVYDKYDETINRWEEDIKKHESQLNELIFSSSPNSKIVQLENTIKRLRSTLDNIRLKDKRKKRLPKEKLDLSMIDRLKNGKY